LKTANASLEFWFLGESNGYYSESVSIKKIWFAQKLNPKPN
jgi:hypothetical protein